MKKILVVEDDMLLNDTLSYSLKNSGYDVASALTATDARQLCEMNVYSLAVLNINLLRWEWL
ncbi:hypothetical protein LJC63_05040 [Ruminococcaceae bacterium OttesenSCG-928-L11]|nr:hypothetical protein [Ruminococcaceae bacterium OttesenSCG-928-L11]